MKKWSALVAVLCLTLWNVGCAPQGTTPPATPESDTGAPADTPAETPAETPEGGSANP